jgi:hypothetical protein
MQRRGRWILAALMSVALLATACSGGSGGSDDPLAEVGADGQLSVTFAGAGGFKLAGTLAVPPGMSGSARGVLIVPTVGPVDRNGVQNETMPDLIYEELSRKFTAAGMVTLRYDRRGYGASTLSGKKASYDDIVTDAKDALKFLMARKEVGKSAVAVVGHDVSGPIALHVAGAEPRVKSVVLISSPGRPLVEPLAESFEAHYGATSASKLRTIASGLAAGAKLPGPGEIPPEQQPILGQGQEPLLRGMFAVDPAVDAAKVKVPVLIVVSSVSTGVKRVDADLIARAVGPSAEIMVVSTGPTLRIPLPDRPPVEFQAGNDSSHVFGARVVDAEPRDEASMDKLTQWLSGKLAAANR